MARPGAPVPQGDSRGDRGPGQTRDRKSGAGHTGYAWDDHLDSWDRPAARPPRRSTAPTRRTTTEGGRPAPSRPPAGTRRVSAPVPKSADRRASSPAAGRRAPRPVAAGPVLAHPVAAEPVRARPTAAPARSFEGDPTIAPPPGGRRVVTITGQGAEAYASRNGTRPSSAQRHRPVPRHERAGFRPDRVAMWAVMLGVLMLLVAAASSHASGLVAHHALTLR